MYRAGLPPGWGLDVTFIIMSVALAMTVAMLTIRDAVVGVAVYLRTIPSSLNRLME